MPQSLGCLRSGTAGAGCADGDGASSSAKTTAERARRIDTRRSAPVGCDQRVAFDAASRMRRDLVDRRGRPSASCRSATDLDRVDLRPRRRGRSAGACCSGRRSRCRRPPRGSTSGSRSCTVTRAPMRVAVRLRALELQLDPVAGAGRDVAIEERVLVGVGLVEIEPAVVVEVADADAAAVLVVVDAGLGRRSP